MRFTFAPDWWSSKTTWTSIGAIVAAVIAAWRHQISWPTAVSAIFVALQTMHLRDAISKSGQ